MCHLDLDQRGKPRVIAVIDAERRVAADDRVGLHFPPDRLHVFDVATGQRRER
jgi:hypothetical protein